MLNNDTEEAFEVYWSLKTTSEVFFYFYYPHILMLPVFLFNLCDNGCCDNKYWNFQTVYSYILVY